MKDMDQGIRYHDCAMKALERDDFYSAQEYFQKALKRTPSYQTYNNLGYFYLSEGRTDENGCVKCADAVGMRYLKRRSRLSLRRLRRVVLAIFSTKRGRIKRRANSFPFLTPSNRMIAFFMILPPHSIWHEMKLCFQRLLHCGVRGVRKRWSFIFSLSCGLRPRSFRQCLNGKRIGSASLILRKLWSFAITRANTKRFVPRYRCFFRNGRYGKSSGRC